MRIGRLARLQRRSQIPVLPVVDGTGSALVIIRIRDIYLGTGEVGAMVEGSPNHSSGIPEIMLRICNGGLALDAARQFEYRDLGRSADSYRHANRPNPSIHVKLATWPLKPTGDIGCRDAAGSNLWADEFQGHLAAVGVSGEAQVDSNLRSPVESVGIVA